MSGARGKAATHLSRRSTSKKRVHGHRAVRQLVESGCRPGSSIPDTPPSSVFVAVSCMSMKMCALNRRDWGARFAQQIPKRVDESRRTRRSGRISLTATTLSMSHVAGRGKQRCPCPPSPMRSFEAVTPRDDFATSRVIGFLLWPREPRRSFCGAGCAMFFV